MTCITFFLDIPRFSLSILTIISSTYFTCLSDSNDLLFVGKEISYLIGFLPILYKTFNNVCLGTGSKPNSKQDSSRFPLTYGYQLFTKSSFSLSQLYSVHHEFLCFFAAGISYSTLTVAVPCGANNPDPDSMGINSQF